MSSNENLPFPVWTDFQFEGSATEYFKIWIVNVLLAIVTLGVYSAWGKVRTESYFYGNTIVNGSSFRYTGDPVKILKGRIISFHFANLMERIERCVLRDEEALPECLDQAPKPRDAPKSSDGGWLKYLSTHPTNNDRNARFRISR